MVPLLLRPLPQPALTRPASGGGSETGNSSAEWRWGDGVRQNAPGLPGGSQEATYPPH